MSTASPVVSQIMYVIGEFVLCEQQPCLTCKGCPGAGKGTLCARLAIKMQWAHISVGNELRNHVRRGGQVDDIVIQCVQTGTLVPVVDLGRILECRMEKLRRQGYTSFIIDGFPRSMDQIEYMQDLVRGSLTNLEIQLTSSQLGAPEQVVFMDCPKDTARVRVLTRGDTSRVDDEELFERRFTEFSNNSPAILAYFEAQNKLNRVCIVR